MPGLAALPCPVQASDADWAYALRLRMLYDFHLAPVRTC